MHKKLKVSILFLLLISILISSVNASDWIKVEVNNEVIEVRKVPVLVDGVELKSLVPSYIHIDRTLVPARFVVEQYGGKVSWDHPTRTVTIDHNKNNIKLRINSDIAYINGVEKKLDNNSIPRLVKFANEDGRTMVPLAFISDMLGYDYGYNDAKRIPYINSKPVEYSSKINKIYFSKGSSSHHKILIDTDKNIEPKLEYVEDGKLVYTFENTLLNDSKTGGKHIREELKDPYINKIEYFQEGNNVKLVIDYEGNVKPNLKKINKNLTNVIGFTKEIDNITFQDGKITVKNAGNVSYNTFKLTNPDRIVVDLLDVSSKNGKPISKNLSHEYLSSVRGSVFSPDKNYKVEDNIYRLVLDVKTGNRDKNIEIKNNGDDIIIIPDESVKNSYLNYNKSGNKSIVEISNNLSVNYRIVKNNKDRYIDVLIPKNKTNLKNNNININNGNLKSIVVTENSKDKVIRINYLGTTTYKLLSKNPNDTIKLELNKKVDSNPSKPNINPKNKTIVIDAGHGGYDPGAVAKNGTREKDLALELALKTEELLKPYGYNVLLTRRTDKYVGLKERANIANRNNADLFISYHINSAGNIESANGIETLYCPAGRSSIKQENQYPFAKIVQDELIKGTNARDRGVKSRPELAVLNSTKMPAVLIEAGFITNTREQNLLKTDSYQEKIAKSVINAINKYFEK